MAADQLFLLAADVLGDALMPEKAGDAHGAKFLLWKGQFWTLTHVSAW